ncbi:acyl carrier protein [Pantoea sp. EKM103V]|uniref:acyl carrier protein n=1 Tax=Pantoea TaxID=53335 RepID=UPI00142D5576|nr:MULTISPECIES: phosphopantetheine-binding protein [Pantoea]KAF6666040.1 acyl carrier protein [Pantoea sp. EKM103V]
MLILAKNRGGKMEDKIFSRIKEMLVDKYYVPYQKVTAEVAYDDLELDSLVLLEISVALEKEFDLKIPDGLVESEMSIGHSVSVILGNNADAA